MQEECLERLRNSLKTLNWTKGIKAWKSVSSFPHAVHAYGDEKGETLPSFRCTCYRSGTKHSFTSMEAAAAIGGRINDDFGWIVKMKEYDIEVVANIDLGKLMFKHSFMCRHSLFILQSKCTSA